MEEILKKERLKKLNADYYYKFKVSRVLKYAKTDTYSLRAYLVSIYGTDDQIVLDYIFHILTICYDEAMSNYDRTMKLCDVFYSCNEKALCQALKVIRNNIDDGNSLVEFLNLDCIDYEIKSMEKKARDNV